MYSLLLPDWLQRIRKRHPVLGIWLMSFNFSLIFGLVGSALVMLINREAYGQTLKISLVLIAVLWVGVAVQLLIGRSKGQQRHQDLITSASFQQLLSEGFELETNGRYFGLIGTHEGYTFRLYYDADYVEGWCLDVYFRGMEDSAGNADMHRLAAVTRKYRTPPLFLPKCSWRVGVLSRTQATKTSGSTSQVKDAMNKAIALLRSERFPPLERTDVNENVRKDPWYWGPKVEAFIPV